MCSQKRGWSGLQALLWEDPSLPGFVGASAPGGDCAPGSEGCILAPYAPLATTESKDSGGGVLLYRAAVNVCVFACVCVWLFVLVHLRSCLSPSNLQVSDQGGPGATLTTEFQGPPLLSSQQGPGWEGQLGPQVVPCCWQRGEEMLTQPTLHNHQEAGVEDILTLI